MASVIGQDSLVTMHFSIKLKDGSVAESTKVSGKPAQLRVGDGSLTAAFEACLIGLKAGESHLFELSPENAFGQPSPDHIHHLDLMKFGSDTPAEPGVIIAFTQPDGTEIPGVVREVVGDSVTVDFNHPLAGQTVIFDVEILSVERASL